MSRCAALGVVRLAPQAAGVHHKTAGYTKMPREDCSYLLVCTASRPQFIRVACCRKDELARVKAAGARVLTLEQLDGLRVSLAPRCTECACDTCASWPFAVGHAPSQPVGSGVPQRLLAGPDVVCAATPGCRCAFSLSWTSAPSERLNALPAGPEHTGVGHRGGGRWGPASALGA